MTPECRPVADYFPRRLLEKAPRAGVFAVAFDMMPVPGPFVAIGTLVPVAVGDTFIEELAAACRRAVRP